MNLLGLNEDQRLGLLAAGLATLAGRGSPMQALGQGGMAGVNAMMGARQGRKQEEFDALKLQMLRDQMEQGRAEFALKQQEYAGKAQAAEADAADRSAIDAAKASPFALFAATGPVPRETDADRYQRMAQATKNPAYAKIYGELADKAREKFGDAKVVMRGNTPELQRYGDHGSTQSVPGVAPPPKFSYQDTGTALVPRSEYDTNPQPIPKQMSLGEAARLRQQQIEHNYRVQQDGANKGGGGGKPQWDAGTGQWVYPPDAQHQTGRAVVPDGYVGKQDPKAAQAQQVPGIIAEAEGILKNATGSYIGAGADRAARVIGVGTPGAEATAQLEVLSAKLMFAQPRFEGPQGVLDVKLYQKAAGDIADDTKPVNVRRAALQTIKRMHERYGASKPIDADNDPLGLRK